MRKSTIVRCFSVFVMMCSAFCAVPVIAQSQPARVAPDASGFALLVDVSDYGDASIKPLPSEGAGVSDIRDALQSTGGFPEGQINILKDGSATREGIIEALTSVMERASGKSEVRFFLYLKGRSLDSQGKTYFLPYDARVGAPSTYIGKAEFDRWWNGIQFKGAFVKFYLWPIWDMSYEGGEGFSSQLASIIRDEVTDADGDRNLTPKEITSRRSTGFPSGTPPLSDGSSREITSLIRLPSILEINSQPAGAAIIVDDEERGVTPAKIDVSKAGSHRILLRKELYHESEEQTVAVGSPRGQRIVVAPYQFTPIGIHGTVKDPEGKTVTGAEVRIYGTEYRQQTGASGEYVFEEWQYGMLAPGKTYEMVAESADGMYSGSGSFDFGGIQDIELSISLAQANWIKVAERRLAMGDRDSVLDMLDANLELLIKGGKEGDPDEFFAEMQPALALEFLAHTKEKLEADFGSPEWHFVAARLAEVSGDTAVAREHWKVVKARASRESQEYKQAVERLKESSPIRQPGVIALLAVGVVAAIAVLGFAGVHVRRWVKFRTFREIPNPYIAGKPISEADMFFGREDVFKFVKGKFSRSAKDITIVLHGGRRTGKTSILRQIANGRLGREFVPVFIDIQEMAGVDTHDFLREIAQKVSECLNLPESEKAELDSLRGELEDKSKRAYGSFDDFLAYAGSKLGGKYLLFLIDEYEILERKVNEGDLTDDIFTYLRNLMQNRDNLAFIFSGSRPFARCERKEWVLTFNMAQPKEVSFLARENAVALITEPLKDYIKYDRKAVDRILRLTAGHPFFTQAICLQIVEDLNDAQENRVTVDRVDQACNDIVENAPFHLAFVWRELSPDEKIVIALLAEIITDGTSCATAGDISSRSSHYELDYDRATINKALARLLEEHLVEKTPEEEAHRFRMDLIRAWVQAEHPTWGVLKEVQSDE